MRLAWATNWDPVSKTKAIKGRGKEEGAGERRKGGRDNPTTTGNS